MYSVKGHKEIVNSIDGVGGLGIGEGAPEIVTGSRDGKLFFWQLEIHNYDYGCQNSAAAIINASLALCLLGLHAD